MTRASITAARTALAAAACCFAAGAFACDINSPTDISCGPANVNPANPLSLNNPANPSSPLNINNPANAASPFNPANQAAAHQQDPATDPSSPYFSQPTYADGILGLFESNPRIVYPAGPVQTCRLGLDCPAAVAASPGATLYGLRPAPASAAAPPYPTEPAHRRHHRHRRAAR